MHHLCAKINNIGNVLLYVHLIMSVLQLASKDNKTTPRLNTVTHPDDVSPRSRSLNEAEQKQLNDKLRISEQRNSEYRNQVQGLKTEIKMAQKVSADPVLSGYRLNSEIVSSTFITMVDDII